MSKDFDPAHNYKKTRKHVGYIERHVARPDTYEKLGFKCGLEVHQQLKTEQKLFCRCPAGIYHDFNDFDAELIRHMRPTLSEMGTYDGTALMEFKTRKNITYRIKNDTTCTYEIDDTPPFRVNREALNYAIEIALMLKTNIVGELHITRKQYLDGSIPTGFQRTAIVGIEGEIVLKDKRIRIIQLSLEEDACREISDIRHERIYSTDRLGIPLIETVTYPDLTTPEQARDAGLFIRFLNRSSGRVRTGIGSGRQDVNVSIAGGTRVEIKGVSHIRNIPELTHNEAFRQKALLLIKNLLQERILEPEKWNIRYRTINFDVSDIQYTPIRNAMEKGWKLVAVNLPKFRGVLSFFTQPGKSFADEISGRLKVIACLEYPNMIHSEDQMPVFDEKLLEKRSKILGSKPEDAQLVFWAPEEDIHTAVETIAERCRLAFLGVPNETRQALADGNTDFERVLPGADRMYPDTDSAPIPIKEELIDKIRRGLPINLENRIAQLENWKIPSHCFNYILRNNLSPLMERIITDFNIESIFLGTLLGQRLKYIEGHHEAGPEFNYDSIYHLFRLVRERDLHPEIISLLLPVHYRYPRLDFDSLLNSAGYKNYNVKKIPADISELKRIFHNLKKSIHPLAEYNWIMGQLRPAVLGNISLSELSKIVREEQSKHKEPADV
ncbi:MAG: Glu-tRNA(Gln) amidotransferase subunit GatE [Candidatus Cloacimonetes bacterium]|nr:Glu-tRNA(Gln) amidotransferase subunit GatE [Candidatus Cloacimonadota bacterium]